MKKLVAIAATVVGAAIFGSGVVGIVKTTKEDDTYDEFEDDIVDEEDDAEFHAIENK